ncbi:hypothetical protein C8R43DRAFT_964010 [Mycena crocata]|nr:hypothetical protein C8R43DRAFT_964010 [Mycena crocata]
MYTHAHVSALGERSNAMGSGSGNFRGFADLIGAYGLHSMFVNPNNRDLFFNRCQKHSEWKDLELKMATVDADETVTYNCPSRDLRSPSPHGLGFEEALPEDLCYVHKLTTTGGDASVVSTTGGDTAAVVDSKTTLQELIHVVVKVNVDEEAGTVGDLLLAYVNDATESLPILKKSQKGPTQADWEALNLVMLKLEEVLVSDICGTNPITELGKRWHSVCIVLLWLCSCSRRYRDVQGGGFEETWQHPCGEIREQAGSISVELLPSVAGFAIVTPTA